MNSPGPNVVLASTSAYRAQLLERIWSGFTCIAPDLEETRLADEEPPAMATRLARLKAGKVAALRPGSLVIGSDQVADLAGRPLSKPGSLENARSQLLACSGQTVCFHTAVCVAQLQGSDLVMRDAQDLTRVRFRTLLDAEIDRYIDLDRPFDCAGSFKIERLGVALFDQVETLDPTALVGLPLIALCKLLREAGLEIP